jgi:hypothetical protein
MTTFPAISGTFGTKAVGKEQTTYYSKNTQSVAGKLNSVTIDITKKIS